MDDFKFNAAKMIAAQKKKHRPVSPESESNWDSSEEDNTAPHISSDESLRSNKKKSPNNTSKANNNNIVGANKKPVINQHLKPNNVLRASGERKSVKNSPAVSIRSGTSSIKKGNLTRFADNGFDDTDENEEPVSVASKTSKKSPKRDERPPYDFRNALQDSDWDDDSDEEERETLKAMRHEMEKHSKQAPVTKEEKKSSPETKQNQNNKKTGVKNFIVKPRKRSSNQDPKPPNSPKSATYTPSPRSPNLAATVSEVELSKMKLASSVDFDNVYENAGELIDTGTYEKESSAHGGNFSKDLPTLPTSGFNSVRENRFVYRYDHGSTAYYDTRYGRQEIYMARIADKSENLVRKCSLEFFSALRIVADFFIILLLEFLRFVAYHVLSVFLVGLLTTLGDYLIKPVLASFFNTIVQPFAVFLYNMGVAFRTVMIPLVDVMRSVFTQFAMLLRSFRLVEVYGRTSPADSNRRMIQEV